MNTKTDTRPAADQLKELRVSMHELYKRKQSELMEDWELEKLVNRIDALGHEIARVQKDGREAGGQVC